MVVAAVAPRRSTARRRPRGSGLKSGSASPPRTTSKSAASAPRGGAGRAQAADVEGAHGRGGAVEERRQVGHHRVGAGLPDALELDEVKAAPRKELAHGDGQ